MRLIGLCLFASATVAFFAATSTALAQASATLTVQFNQAPTASTTRVFEVMSKGLPPSGSTEFVDSSGTHEATAHVTSVTPGARCLHAQILRTGLGDYPWC